MRFSSIPEHWMNQILWNNTACEFGQITTANNWSVWIGIFLCVSFSWDTGRSNIVACAPRIVQSSATNTYSSSWIDRLSASLALILLQVIFPPLNTIFRLDRFHSVLFGPRSIHSSQFLLDTYNIFCYLIWQLAHGTFIYSRTAFSLILLFSINIVYLLNGGKRYVHLPFFQSSCTKIIGIIRGSVMCKREEKYHSIWYCFVFFSLQRDFSFAAMTFACVRSWPPLCWCCFGSLLLLMNCRLSFLCTFNAYGSPEHICII